MLWLVASYYARQLCTLIHSFPHPWWNLAKIFAFINAFSFTKLHFIISNIYLMGLQWQLNKVTEVVLISVFLFLMECLAHRQFPFWLLSTELCSACGGQNCWVFKKQVTTSSVSFLWMPPLTSFWAWFLSLPRGVGPNFSVLAFHTLASQLCSLGGFPPGPHGAAK